MVAKEPHWRRFYLSKGRQPTYISPYGLHVVDDVPDGDLEKKGAEILAQAIQQYS